MPGWLAWGLVPSIERTAYLRLKRQPSMCDDMAKDTGEIPGTLDVSRVMGGTALGLVATPILYRSPNAPRVPCPDARTSR
jgi:hypothetical protein